MRSVLRGFGFVGCVGTLAALLSACGGNGSTNVYRHTDTAVTDPEALQVVYRFAP